MTDPQGFSSIFQALIGLAAIAIILLFVKFAAPVLAPVLLAAFIAIVSLPALQWMMQHGVPKWIALAAILFVLFDLGSILALLMTSGLEGFRENLPGYQQRFELLSEQLGNWLEAAGIEGSRAALPDMVDARKVVSFVRAALASVSNTLGVGLLVLLTVAFILAESSKLGPRIKKAFGDSESFESQWGRVLDSLSQYMLIKIVSSFATGLIVWLLLWALGIDFAALWALLAFVLNFIPFVGAILMMIPPVLLAMVQADLETALLVAVGFIAANTVIGNVLEPRFMGKGLGISTLAVFLSLIFWGWLLGTIGVFLSVPLTIVLIAVLEANESTRPVAVLLSADEGESSLSNET
jgi:AI-2 transport protein TqsA